MVISVPLFTGVSVVRPLGKGGEGKGRNRGGEERANGRRRKGNGGQKGEIEMKSMHATNADNQKGLCPSMLVPFLITHNNTHFASDSAGLSLTLCALQIYLLIMKRIQTYRNRREEKDVKERAKGRKGNWG